MQSQSTPQIFSPEFIVALILLYLRISSNSSHVSSIVLEYLLTNSPCFMVNNVHESASTISVILLIVMAIFSSTFPSELIKSMNSIKVETFL